MHPVQNQTQDWQAQHTNLELKSYKKKSNRNINMTFSLVATFMHVVSAV
jgi:hypothetical protein